KGYDGGAITVKESGKDNLIGSFCWSPDPGKLAYYRGTTLTVMDIASGNEKEIFSGQASGVAWSQDGKRVLTSKKGAFVSIDVDNGSLRTVECVAWSGYGPMFWSKDEKSALYYSSDNILKIQIEQGAKPVSVMSRGSGLIDGLSW
ncbi:MAG: hypothetical protein LLG37_07400, partial [Spirochaetia bacterium]|nr:hypothetical protein [Spirochaetia bacterium]